MTSSTYKLEFLMPCLCAGADPKTAELRPSAVRGQLRWWFRALGGSFDEESRVFGRIGKQEETLGSAVVVRTRILGKPPVWNPPVFKPIDPEAYVWHFARASGRTDDDKANNLPGPRWQPEGAFAPGTKWELRIVVRRPLDAALQAKFDEALTCFLSLGALGLRATRGLGTFHCADRPFDERELRPVLEKAGFALESKGFVTGQKDDKTGESGKGAAWAKAAALIGSLVKGTRKTKGWKNDSQTGKETPSPLGTSGLQKPTPRQMSAIWFRPVRDSGREDGLRLWVFEAPHARVLGEVSRKDVSVGKTPSQIVPPPSSPQRKWN